MMAGRKSESRSGAAYASRYFRTSAFSVVQQHIWVGIAQISVLAHVMPAVARKIVHQRHAVHQMRFICKVDILNLQVDVIPLLF